MFGEALRLIRAFHDVNQSDLAAQLGVSRSYLSEIESGKKTPSLELLKRYASHFDLSLSTLVLFSERFDEPENLIGLRKLLGRKAIAILQWIEKKSDSSVTV